MSRSIRLETDRLILRKVVPEDAKALARYRSEPTVSRYQSWQGSYEEVKAREMIRSQLELEVDVPGTWYQLVILEKEVGEEGGCSIVGDLAFHFVEQQAQAHVVDGQVELGINLDPRFQGKGYASEALTCAIEYLIQVLGKRRIFAITDAENLSAESLFLRLGFRKEAHLVENVWFKGSYGSEYLFAILAREWKARRREGGATGGQGGEPEVTHLTSPES
ncbi:acyl-CoA N-acyltransferase [Violaceomyces palustris]|uniref:Acyl-CoA N-acyltransferase n=1 Tax=Violaceomyces palustris TaxID=1673888 RepID=A0ACD0P4C5_9BASI|nr:acyl-CoA N-acyltransferase [Violaceomyces palustris]